MKIKSLLPLLFVFLTMPLLAQNTSPAVAYLNELITPIDGIKTETWQYLKAITRGKGARKVESKRQKLLTEIKKVEGILASKKGFNSDETLKNELIAYLKLSYIVLKEDFDEILDMEDIAEQSYDMMEAYLLAKEKANDKLDEAGQKMMDAQNAFAEANNITFLEGEEDKTAEKIEKAGNALKYYNEIYLIFFKCYKQEIYVLDAIQRSDVNSIEQNNESLLMFAEEGLKKLAKIEGFNRDKNLIYALKEILNFYKTEAEIDFKAASNFLIERDNFERINKELEAISKKKRTQEDVDKYNNAANKYNEAVNKNNAIIESSNKIRSEKLNNWNKKVEAFFEKHS